MVGAERRRSRDDIENGRLAVEVTADEAAEITTPRPAQAGHHFLTHIT